MAEQHDLTNRPKTHPDRQAGAPSPGGAEVTPSDEFLTHVASSIYVGGQGDLTVVGLDGYEVTYNNYIGRIPMFVVKVLEESAEGTATTATNIVAEW